MRPPRALRTLSVGRQGRDQATHLGGDRRDAHRTAATRSPHPVITAIIRIIPPPTAFHAGAAALTHDLSTPLPPPRSAHATQNMGPNHAGTEQRSEPYRPRARPCGALTACRRCHRARPFVTSPIVEIADITWSGGTVRRHCDRDPLETPSDVIQIHRDRQTLASGDRDDRRTNRRRIIAVNSESVQSFERDPPSAPPLKLRQRGDRCRAVIVESHRVAECRPHGYDCTWAEPVHQCTTP